MLHSVMPFQMKKQFGQHFLRQVPKEVLFPLDVLEQRQSLQKNTSITIYEIGPGSGVVTQAVVQQLLPFSHLSITYEVVDIDLEAIQTTKELITSMALPKRFKFIYTHKDVLKHSPTAIDKAEFIYIFGSLPYNISKKIVNATKHFSIKLSQKSVLLPSRFIIQKEVAEDYVSAPPSAAFLGADLSLFADYRKITKKLPPGAFFPPPKVESAVLEIGWKSLKSTEGDKALELAKVIRQGFIAKRKVIGSVFKNRINDKKKTPTLEHLMHLRAHEVSIAEWELIFHSLSK